MRTPTQAEINVYDSLDERAACDHFLGKTLDEAEALFAENALYYQEDLMWMGPKAFRFYVFAAIRCIETTQNPEMVSGLAGVLEFRLEYERQELEPIAEPLLALCRYVSSHSQECGLPQSDEEIAVQAGILRNVMTEVGMTQDLLPEGFDPERYLNLRYRYESLRDSFAKMI